MYTLFWFRRDFRLEDNTALHYALQEQHPVLPIFIFDRHILDKLEDRHDARVNFIHQRIAQLKQTLETQYQSSIRVEIGTPLEVFKKLVTEIPIASVFTNRDYEPYALERDKAVDDFLKTQNIGFYTFKDHVIFEKKEITTDAGEPYKVFTPYSRKWKESLKQLSLQPLPMKHTQWAKVNPFPMPSLEEIGFSASQITLPPSDLPLSIVKKYHTHRDFPALRGTTRLGIHLRFGTVSIRQMVAQARLLNEIWLNELIWREFYIMILANFPQVVNEAFKPAYNHIPWRNDATEFQKWCEGHTGYPIVDAGMRELNATGFMHNRVRMIVASFLTKHLLIDWRWGEAYFAQKLLDFELASNNGGWQWAAGTGTDAQPYFRVFNPQSQTEKFDKQLEYIKKWVPELGTSRYPKPMVDHKMARERAIKTYKEALENTKA
ncbi:deoxyribodipyrimidine photo-lyase [Cytophagales bacterium LB-30]|uniref:Deoxyribodipyrimidine photo-lyase n=1 Tax=Shiella aurantiaca TaxID=3058365 RepID=A0ABT8F1P4_9BACT|nr:deoxyribodipyrimidine photo-lyase [Shiella aurantiaca]MDN4164367.1 deoxyribodipyrimidine photo-lyase [Shiella aurantiaca]